MNKLLVFSALFTANVFAATPGAPVFGRIVDLKGEGFVSFQGKTREIQKGDTIEVGAEIVIEHKGQVTFTDNADHRFHLGNASSAGLRRTSVELRSGDLWFQSLNKTDNYRVTSANASVDYQGGEAILTYDSVKGKSQLMVINGIMKLSNLRAQELNLSVTEGQFSFVDNSYEEGAPRDPTPVGEKTYAQLVSLFSGIGPMDKNSEALFKEHPKHEEHAKVDTGRSVASVETKTESKGETKGESSLLEEYKQSLLHKTTAKKVTNKSPAPKMEKKSVGTSKLVIHVYGRTSTPTYVFSTDTVSAERKTRAPASVLDQAVPKDEVGSTPSAATGETKPYSKDYKNQYKESDKLIDELKKL